MSSARLMRAARSLQADDSVLKQTVTPGTAMRMLKFSRAYAGLLSIFLVIVVVDAIVGIINPLLYRDIIPAAVRARRGADGVNAETPGYSRRTLPQLPRTQPSRRVPR